MYTVKFLDSDSFDRLPYKRIHTSIGVADRNEGVAYVRDRGNPMDIFTAYHELEHLKGDDLHEHETPGEDGVYYKDTGGWMQTAAPLAAFIPGVGPMASMALGAGGTMMSQRSQAKQQKASMGQQPQQATMNQFNPSAAMPQNAAPATSQVGGGDMGGGGLESGTIDKVRKMMNQRQSGFYSGRDAGGYA